MTVPTDPRPAGTGWPRVQVHPGDGVVRRGGTVLLVVPVLAAADVEPVRELLEVCARPPAGQDPGSAVRAVLRRAGELPGFALVLRSGRSLRVLVHGPVRVRVDGREERAASPSGGGPAEVVVEDAGWQRLSICGDGDPPAPDPPGVLPLDLDSGTVPGSGVTLYRRSAAGALHAAAGGPTSSTQLRPAVRFRSVLLGESALRAGQRPFAPRPRPPLPVAGDSGSATADRGTGPADVLVEGVTCPGGHVTDPGRATCLTCGSPLPAGSPRVALPRPPLGLLVTDSGTIYPVTGDYVIGREPEHAPEVLAGRARPLPLRDAARSTSRVHAVLTVRGWQVLLTDDRSANGTFLSRSGAGGPWLPVAAHPPVALVHGDRIRLGQRQVLFDVWRGAAVPQLFQ